MKAFQVFSVFMLIAFSFAMQGASKPKYSAGDKVRYETHSGALKEATIERVILPSSEEGEVRYGISSGLVKTQVLESSIVGVLEKTAFQTYRGRSTLRDLRNTRTPGKVKEKENTTPNRELTASPARWEFVKTLPPVNPNHPWEALPE